ncbi:hypothetical protein [Chromobacterium sp. IIBBL 290-4]|uniref:hypothetical protein n=1 Tax=Chromobacterium sp. IIBBL 290-4 TaxID=2953890 RepID=UPI0020B6DE56|nr:hypothetical protein [Chromobacterium sp. IIBBL 290-4]UTH73762.1 hypothetical protein NKT35_19795 [Chromobacterium sp. IIBBL 290-4]
MFRKSLYAAALRHAGQQMIDATHQLDLRRDDFDVVEELGLEARDAGLSSETMSSPPATPYLKVQPLRTLTRHLSPRGSIVAMLGISACPAVPVLLCRPVNAIVRQDLLKAP